MAVVVAVAVIVAVAVAVAGSWPGCCGGAAGGAGRALGTQGGGRRWLRPDVRGLPACLPGNDWAAQRSGWRLRGAGGVVGRLAGGRTP